MFNLLLNLRMQKYFPYQRRQNTTIETQRRVRAHQPELSIRHNKSPLSRSLKFPETDRKYFAVGNLMAVNNQSLPLDQTGVSSRKGKLYPSIKPFLRPRLNAKAEADRVLLSQSQGSYCSDLREAHLFAGLGAAQCRASLLSVLSMINLARCKGQGSYIRNL